MKNKFYVKWIVCAIALCSVSVFVFAGCKGCGKNVAESTVITISRTALTLELWDSFELTATSTGSEIEWSSSNPSIASVDEYGNVIGNSIGVATITAGADGVSKDCEVKVVLDAVIIPLLFTNVTNNEVFLEISDVFPVFPSVTYKGLPGGAGGKFTYGTPDGKGVVSVSADGSISALKSGTETVSISGVWNGYAGTSMYAEVTVKVY